MKHKNDYYSSHQQIKAEMEIYMYNGVLPSALQKRNIQLFYSIDGVYKLWTIFTISRKKSTYNIELRVNSIRFSANHTINCIFNLLILSNHAKLPFSLSFCLFFPFIIFLIYFRFIYTSLNGDLVAVENVFVFIIRCHDIFYFDWSTTMIWLIFVSFRSFQAGGLHNLYRCVCLIACAVDVRAIFFSYHFDTLTTVDRCKRNAQMTTQSYTDWTR